MAVLACDLMLGVFSRYVLLRTFTWYDEIARACFVWVVFLGAAVGVKRGAHFGLHMLVDMLPKHARRLAGFVTPVVDHGVLRRAGRAGPRLHGVRPVPAIARDGHLESLDLCGDAGRRRPDDRLCRCRRSGAAYGTPRHDRGDLRGLRGPARSRACRSRSRSARPDLSACGGTAAIRSPSSCSRPSSRSIPSCCWRSRCSSWRAR